MNRVPITRDTSFDISKALFGGDVIEAKLGNILLNLNKDTLIPHPSELLMIDRVVELARANGYTSIADIGTGSGSLSIGIAKQLRDVHVYATDILDSILSIAEENAALNNVSDQITFLKNTNRVWLSEFHADTHVDMLVSNPPFITDEKFNSEEYRTKFPASKSQPEGALRIFGNNPTSPFVEIFTNAERLKVKKIVFRFDPEYIDLIQQELEKRAAKVKRFYDGKGVLRFIEVDTPYMHEN